MRRIAPAFLVATVAVASACSDAAEHSNPNPVSPQAPATAAPLIVPEEGQPTYYEYDTTISGAGGLPGWSRPSEAHSRTLKEIYRWSYSTGFWDVENNYPSPEQQFTGYVQSTAVDVSRTLKRRTSITSTSRAGPTLSVSSQPPIDLVQQGTGPSANVVAASIASFNRAVGGTGGVRTNAPRFDDTEVRASRADRVVPSMKGRARELALLARQFGRATTLVDGTMEFRKAEGTGELQIHFTPSIGAVTRIVRYEGGTRRAEIVRAYHRRQGAWVLASIETRTFDSTGKFTNRFVQDITNVVMQ